MNYELVDRCLLDIKILIAIALAPGNVPSAEQRKFLTDLRVEVVTRGTKL